MSAASGTLPVFWKRSPTLLKRPSSASSSGVPSRPSRICMYVSMALSGLLASSWRAFSLSFATFRADLGRADGGVVSLLAGEIYGQATWVTSHATHPHFSHQIYTVPVG